MGFAQWAGYSLPNRERWRPEGAGPGYGVDGSRRRPNARPPVFGRGRGCEFGRVEEVRTPESLAPDGGGASTVGV